MVKKKLFLVIEHTPDIWGVGVDVCFKGALVGETEEEVMKTLTENMDAYLRAATQPDFQVREFNQAKIMRGDVKKVKLLIGSLEEVGDYKVKLVKMKRRI